MGMKEKLMDLNKEDLVEILFRVYDVHQKDVEYYMSKDNKLLINVYQTRIDRIDRYVNSLLKK